MSWENYRFFVAVLKERTLVGAAKRLRVDQTTVGRRIASLEGELGTTLFRKTRDGYLPTPEGKRLAPHVEELERAVFALERSVSAAAGSLAGRVTLTAPEGFANQILAPHLGQFFARYPEIELKLRTSQELLNLAAGDADVAIRMARPEDSTLVGRKIGELVFHLYGAVAYLEKHGVPAGKRDLHAHHWVGCFGDFARDSDFAFLRGLGAKVHPRVEVSSRTTLQSLIQAGVGIGALPSSMGDALVELRRLPLPEIRRLPIWIVMAPGFQDTPRVRALVEFLTELVRSRSERLQGR